VIEVKSPKNKEIKLEKVNIKVEKKDSQPKRDPKIGKTSQKSTSKAIEI